MNRALHHLGPLCCITYIVEFAPCAPAGAFPAVINVLQSVDESIARECVYVLTNPWAHTVSVSHEVAEGLLAAGLIKVGD